MSDSYYRVPLSMLRHGGSPLEALSAMLETGTINAGIAAMRGLSNADLQQRFNDAMARHDFTLPDCGEREIAAMLGSAVVGMIWGDPGRIFEAAQVYRELEEEEAYRHFFTIKGAFLWAALETARAEAWGDPGPERRISWREFRILAAIASAPVNRRGFSIIGWESLRNRACGCVNRETFQKMEEFPDHAAPLSRKQVRKTLRDLEALRFFACFRLSSGDRGGWTAYSFRHPDRQALGVDVCEWSNFNRRGEIDENRQADREQSLQLLKRAKSGPSGVQGPGHAPGQGEGQGRVQHNEKSYDDKSSHEKSIDEKSSNECPTHRRAETPPVPKVDRGWLFEGKFYTTEEMTRLGLWKPELLSMLALGRKAALRHEDGTIVPVESGQPV